MKKKLKRLQDIFSCLFAKIVPIFVSRFILNRFDVRKINILFLTYLLVHTFFEKDNTEMRTEKI
jgi:hypothetical protein